MTDAPVEGAKREDRIRSAAQRSEVVLSTRLAQSVPAPTLGMEMKIGFMENTRTGESVVAYVKKPLPDWDDLALAAVYARPFTLERDLIYGVKVANAMAHFAPSEELKSAALQVAEMWRRVPFKRAFLQSGKVGAESTDWVSSSDLGDKLLYSKIVHAHDNHELLDAFRDEDQKWGLSAVVGDWLSVIAHQEALMHAIRPDLCPQVTPWAGDDQTVFRRLGISLDDSEPDPSGTSA